MRACKKTQEQGAKLYTRCDQDRHTTKPLPLKQVLSPVRYRLFAASASVCDCFTVTLSSASLSWKSAQALLCASMDDVEKLAASEHFQALLQVQQG